ncbi:MAG: type II secretion system secretin GspD [Acidobacteria bacterium]|nr:type II secretion system secretin GspD [Acidobacteriota bacterium]
MISLRSSVAVLALATVLRAQQPAPPPVAVPPGFGPRFDPATQQPETPPAKSAPAPQTQPAKPGAPPPGRGSLGGFSLQNASLVEVVDQLARVLKINYVLDPRVKGGVILNTYGEVKTLDPRALLDMVLRINGAAMVQVGELFRVVPLSDVSRLPLKPQVDPMSIAEDDRVLLNLIFLKYATVEELSKLLTPFVGEGAQMFSYAPANLLLILDSGRNMRRTMELIGMFDSDALASQRVRLFETEHGRPSDLAKELEGIMKAVSMGGKSSTVHFLPVDRINTLVAIAPNPGVFDEVEKWLKKLDIAAKTTAGSIDNYVYRVKYGRAEMMAGALMQLYGGMGMYGSGMGGYGMGGYGGGGYGMGGYGGGGYGMGGYGGGGYGMGGYGGGGYGMGGYGGGGYGMGAPMMSYQPVPYAPGQAGGGAAAVPPGGTAAGATAADQTGMYMGGGAYGYGSMGRIPRVVPNPMDNTLLIQGTPQEYEQILKVLTLLDVAPRQVLIDARIYEVSLTGAFASGVAAFLQKRGATSEGSASLSTRSLLGSAAGTGVNLTAGMLVGQSRELLAFLSAKETSSRAKVISAPSVIATDSITASINVGTEVPTLTAQAVTGVQSAGSSLFANTISNRNSGVTLSITARVNPSGIVTLIINQEVSSPIAPAAGAIQSPSFSKRSVSTQVTVQDGDTIAIGGIINESSTLSTAGIPILHRIPVLGAAFGNRSTTKERTELVIFMTPRVIYDTSQITEASDEIRSRLKRLRSLVKE